MSISGYASLSVLRQFPLRNKITIPFSKVLPIDNYVQTLYERHWPISLHQTYTQPLQLKTGELLYCDPAVASGTFLAQYKPYSTHIDYVTSRNQAIKSSLYHVALHHHSLGFFLRELNHHPDSSQHFFHLKPQKPFMILLAPPKPILAFEDITAYLVNQTIESPRGLVIAPGVWHSPPIPLFDKTTQEIFTQQTKSHNCILWDTLHHSNQWIHVKSPSYIFS